MSRHQETASHGWYDPERQIPRRSSATAAELARRQTQTTSAPATRSHHTNEEGDARPPVGVIGRSAIRYRPISPSYVIPFSDGTEMHVTEQELDTLPEDYQTAAQLITPHLVASRLKRQPTPKRPVQDEMVYELPPAKTHPGGTDALPKQRRQRSRFHWLFWLGIAMVSLLVGYVLLNIVATWWQVTQDDWRYGRPRTFQMDATVGHGTAQHPSSHFIAINLNRHIEVIEIPGGDPAHSKIYVGPTLIGEGEDLTPVTLSFEDVNHDGRPDLVMHVGESTVIFLNQPDGTFKPAPNQ